MQWWLVGRRYRNDCDHLAAKSGGKAHQSEHNFQGWELIFEFRIRWLETDGDWAKDGMKHVLSNCSEARPGVVFTGVSKLSSA